MFFCVFFTQVGILTVIHPLGFPTSQQWQKELRILVIDDLKGVLVILSPSLVSHLIMFQNKQHLIHLN